MTRPTSLMPDRTKWWWRWTTWSPVVLVLLLTIAAAPWLISPKVPSRVVIATGRPDGAYFAFATRYQEILARDGIELVIRETAGSIENRALLESDDSGVTLAFIQGGTIADAADANLVSLASLYHEPIWVFYRGEEPVTRLTELSGERIAVGPEGSGTRAVAETLLWQNGVEDESEQSAKLLNLTGREAADALRAGRIDAAFFVVSPESPLILELLEDESVRLMNFSRAAAYERRFSFLDRVVLHQGMVDFERDLPARDVSLIAPTANLVARSDIHPALIPLMLSAAEKVHEGGGLLEEPGEFPSALHVDAPLHADAARYLKSGPSILFKYLPFSVAATLDRMKLMLLPFCTLLFPLIKAAPPVYRWRIRYRIYRWYHVLREIDQKLKNADPAADFSDDIERLKTLESELTEVSVPLSYMEEFYNLHLHIAFVRGRLEERRKQRLERQSRRSA
ncbi:MAG: C4-dicarboxylate ABC transporter substrate-binding protein [Planctomycetota bacterium]|nr:MAG: C4-dicarboxylate ABC transporter substrate-binding protein [Planctomycetota bacterium]